jgi:hypothetical protein
MKFIYIDENAASELVSERFLQSTEFDQGRDLVDFLFGKKIPERPTPKTIYHKYDDGLYILPSDIKPSINYLVIDLEKADYFPKLGDEGCLFVLQKILRFATKYWKDLKPSISERFIPNSSKTVIFPYPIGQQTSLRVTVERNPDAKRREKREKGKALLIYRIGTDEGGGPNEEASVTNFRRSMEGLQGAIEEINSKKALDQKSESNITAMSVTCLSHEPIEKLPGEIGFDTWLKKLTTLQKQFVSSSFATPQRIEGPAGTGKTLCLVLKCLHNLLAAKNSGIPYKALFIAHSEATRQSIQDLFFANDQWGFSNQYSYNTPQSVKIATLHMLCGDVLNTDISESEFLDRDAYESKMVQLLYAYESLIKIIKGDLESHKPYLSTQFRDFLAKTDEWVLAEMLQHEISIKIKGRAEEELDKYKKLPRLNYGLPVENDGDKTFVFLMYDAYQELLKIGGQFDTDDVVLSALAQLSTPIWRRRRSREGFESIFIDETHLFNLNELSVFHRLTVSESRFPIAYSVDRSQALGDRGWSEDSFELALDPERRSEANGKTIKVQSVFRCSPDIVNLAFSVTASGATLFTNFDDPMVHAISTFTAEEEKKCSEPKYLQYISDTDLITQGLKRAECLAREMNITNSDIAIVAFAPDLFNSLVEYCKDKNKPIEIIKQRGDFEIVKKARKSGRFLLSSPDYIGGLEFDAVILIGVDATRVPPKSSSENDESANFLSYSAHQRLYVAITRGRFRVEILGTKARGISKLLSAAIESGLLKVEEG